MTRVMYDALNPAGIPVGAPLVASYIDHPSGGWTFAERQRLMASRQVDITAVPHSSVWLVAHVCDCESTDYTPDLAVDWVVESRGVGHDPTVYCNESSWQSIRDAFHARSVAEPHYWVAAYPGYEGATIPPGAIGHQWIDHGPYDESVMADYWPGVDPAPPPPPPERLSTMQALYDPNGHLTIVGDAKDNGNLLVFTEDSPGHFGVIDVTFLIKQEDPADSRTYQVT